MELRKLCVSDCNERYLEWMKDDEVNRFLEVDAEELTIEKLKEYVRVSEQSRMRVNFAIVVDKKHIGNASIYRTRETPDYCFHTGWFIGEREYWGSHRACQVMFILFEIGFCGFRLKTCTGSIYRDNIKARMSNRFIGYEEIGNISHYSKRRRRLMDSISLAIDIRKWEKKKDELIRLFPEYYKELRIPDGVETSNIWSDLTEAERIYEE